MAEKEEFWSLAAFIARGRGRASGYFPADDFCRSHHCGIAVGVVLGALLFLHRMAESVEVAGGRSPLEDVADDVDSRTRYDAGQATNRDVMVYQIDGAFLSALPRAYWAS